MSLPKITPLLPTFRKDFPLNKEGWVYSVKFDGYRCILYKDGDKIWLESRYDQPLVVSEAFLAKLKEYLIKYESIVLDGELIAVDKNHLSGNFAALQNRQRTACVLQFRCFDVCIINGKDVRSAILRDRLKFVDNLGIKEVHFRTISHKSSASLLDLSIYPVCEKFDNIGASQGRHPDIEGFVAKQLTSRYEGGKQLSWIKIATRDTKLLICINANKGFGRLCNTVGSLDLVDATLRPVGSVGAGLTDNQREELKERVFKMGEKFIPFGVEVTFPRLTTARELHHPTFIRTIELTNEVKIDTL